MKTIRLMMCVFGCLTTTSWGADSRQLLEGAAAEAESSVSFFKREIESKINDAERAITAFKEFCANSKQTLPDKYQCVTALKDLESTAQTLQKLQGLLEESKFNADRIWTLLDTLPDRSE